MVLFLPVTAAAENLSSGALIAPYRACVMRAAAFLSASREDAPVVAQAARRSCDDARQPFAKAVEAEHPNQPVIVNEYETLIDTAMEQRATVYVMYLRACPPTNIACRAFFEARMHFTLDGN